MGLILLQVLLLKMKAIAYSAYISVKAETDSPRRRIQRPSIMLYWLCRKQSIKYTNNAYSNVLKVNIICCSYLL